MGRGRPGRVRLFGVDDGRLGRRRVALGHFTGAQVTAGTPEPADLSQAVAGDLVFIPGSAGTAAAPRHVGMITGWGARRAGRRLYLIQAPHTGAVVELTEVGAWAGQIAAVRHLS